MQADKMIPDMLKCMFEIQAMQDKRWVDYGRFKSDVDYRNAIIKERLLDIVGEIIELRGTFNVSEHKLKQVENLYNSKIQIVDALKYLIGFAHLLGITSDELYEAFAEKSKTLESRWDSELIEFTKKTKVVCFDLDGVGADYSTGFSKYLILQGLKPEYPHTERESYSFYQQFGITKSQEEIHQKAFIEGGGFRELPLMDGFKLCVDICHQLGIKVVIISSRPAWIYNRIYEDTRVWLENNDIRYHMLRWDKDKADTVINHVYPANILAFIEDRDKHAIELVHIDVPVLLINRSYNQSMNDSRLIRVSKWFEIIEYIKSKV